MSEKIILEKISVEEKLPEYDYDCIVWFKDSIGVYVASYDKEKGWTNGRNSFDVSFWAKFPD